MGAGISKSRLDAIIYRRLKKLQGEIGTTFADSVCSYARLTLGGQANGHSFSVAYAVLRVSNAETCAYPVYHVDGKRIEGMTCVCESEFFGRLKKAN